MYFGTKRIRDFHEIGGSLSVHGVNAFRDFDRISARVAERTIHGCDERNNWTVVRDTE